MRGQICFGKFNSCFDHLCCKKFADKISMDLDINTFNTFASLVIVLNNITYNNSSPAFYYQIAHTLKNYF